MTHTHIRDFFKSHPAISRRQFCKGIGVGHASITLITKGRKALTLNVRKKLLPVMLKYGWKWIVDGGIVQEHEGGYIVYRIDKATLLFATAEEILKFHDRYEVIAAAPTEDRFIVSKEIVRPDTSRMEVPGRVKMTSEDFIAPKPSV